MSSCNRNDVAAAGIASKLLKVAQDRHFIKYSSEEPQVMESKLDVKGIAASKKFIQVLWEQDNQLNYKRTIVRAALRNVLDKKWRQWNLKEKHNESLLKHAERRAMNMLRHVSQALRTPTITKFKICTSIFRINIH